MVGLGAGPPAGLLFMTRAGAQGLGVPRSWASLLIPQVDARKVLDVA